MTVIALVAPLGVRPAETTGPGGGAPMTIGVVGAHDEQSGRRDGVGA